MLSLWPRRPSCIVSPSGSMGAARSALERAARVWWRNCNFQLRQINNAPGTRWQRASERAVRLTKTREQRRPERTLDDAVWPPACLVARSPPPPPQPLLTAPAPTLTLGPTLPPPRTGEHCNHHHQRQARGRRAPLRAAAVAASPLARFRPEGGGGQTRDWALGWRPPSASTGKGERETERRQ